MFEYLKGILKWIFRKDTLSNIIFGIRAAKALFGNGKNKALVKRLNQVQGWADEINRIIPNNSKSKGSTTEGMVKLINDNQKEFRGLVAEFVPDKHGKGIDGARIGYKGKIAGINIDAGHDFIKGQTRIGFSLGF